MCQQRFFYGDDFLPIAVRMREGSQPGVGFYLISTEVYDRLVKVVLES